MRNGRGEADLRAQRRDHEVPRVEHGAGAKRVPLTLGGRRARSLEQGGRRPPWTPRKRCCRRPSRYKPRTGGAEGTRRGYQLPSVLRLGRRFPSVCPGIERGSCRSTSKKTPGGSRDTHGTNGCTRAHGSSHRRTLQPSKPTRHTPGLPLGCRDLGLARPASVGRIGCEIRLCALCCLCVTDL